MSKKVKLIAHLKVSCNYDGDIEFENEEEMRTWLHPIHEKYNYNTDKELVEIIGKIDLFLGYVAGDIGAIRADLWLEWEGQDE